MQAGSDDCDVQGLQVPSLAQKYGLPLLGAGAQPIVGGNVFMSVEQPNLTPVFGTSCPPKGLSGLLREYAYQFGEGANRHWMTLVLADRVDMIESMVMDAFRGRGEEFRRPESGIHANQITD